MDGVAGDPAGGVGGEEGDDRADIVGLAGPLERLRMPSTMSPRPRRPASGRRQTDGGKRVG